MMKPADDRITAGAFAFTVVNDGAWIVDCNGQEFGPYANRAVAVDAANAAASRAAFYGREASVLIAPGP